MASKKLRYGSSVWAVCAALALLSMMGTQRAKAEDCVPLYSGCVSCMYAENLWDYGFVSGWDVICAYNSPSPYVGGYIGVYDPWAGYINVYCSGVAPLEQSGQSCGPAAPAGQQNVYRSSTSALHFLYSTSYAEGINAGWSYNGIAFTTHPTALDGNMAPLYRCNYAPYADHFASVDPNCEGSTYEGILGYVSTIERDGYTPLYRFSGRVGSHVITKYFWEGTNAHYTYEGVLGYVPN